MECLYLWRMKKILLLFSAVLCLASCVNFKDIKINSVRLEKVSVVGAPLGAVLAVEIDNPGFALRNVEISGMAKFLGEDALGLVIEPFDLTGHTQKIYHLVVNAELKEGFSLMNVLRVVQTQDLSGVTLDLDVIVKDALGIKHRKELKDIAVWEELQRL